MCAVCICYYLLLVVIHGSALRTVANCCSGGWCTPPSYLTTVAVEGALSPSPKCFMLLLPGGGGGGLTPLRGIKEWAHPSYDTGFTTHIKPSLPISVLAFQRFDNLKTHYYNFGHPCWHKYLPTLPIDLHLLLQVWWQRRKLICMYSSSFSDIIIICAESEELKHLLWSHWWRRQFMAKKHIVSSLYCPGSTKRCMPNLFVFVFIFAFLTLTHSSSSSSSSFQQWRICLHLCNSLWLTHLHLLCM